jgi:FkbM family methyltransferase
LRALAAPPSVTRQHTLVDLHSTVLNRLGFANADSRTNGELMVVGKVLGERPALVFDVGANDGGYSSLLLDMLGGDIRVHSFEPSPAAYLELERRFDGDERVEVHNIGLSDEEGAAVLLTHSAGSALASLYRRDHINLELHVTETVRLRRLDSFCAELGIERVDFLKVDAEGHDLAVLRGAGSLLDGKRIAAIQFEHGGTAPDARVFLRDFFDLLTPTYVIHRVLPDGLWPLGRYTEQDEVAVYANYVALPA